MGGTGLQPVSIALQYIPAAVSAFVLVVRLWKKHRDNCLGGDDATIVLAWILGMINSILTHLYILATFGGYYEKDIPMQKFLANQAYGNKLQYAFAIEYNTVVCVVKLSFLWSLQKLRSRNPWIRRSLWAIQITNMVYMVIAVFLNIFPCIPYEKKWHPEIAGHCLDSFKFVIGSVSVVLITDFLVLLMPTWIIYDLQMPWKNKALSIGFLSMGIIVIVIGILRLIWLSNVFKGIFHNHSVEQAYSAIECNVAIIGASGPTVKYIFSFIFPFLKSTPNTSNAKSSGYGTGYGTNSSQRNARRGQRSAYDDLDSDSVERENIELKGSKDWAWSKTGVRKDEDAKSDEQRITNDINDGITKTVDWTISTREGSVSGVAAGRKNSADARAAVKPANMV